MSALRGAGPAAHLAAAAVAAAAAVGAAHVSIPLFVVVAAAGLAVVGHAAVRWPLATLVGGALATLADPVLVPRLLPPGVGSGPIGLSEPVLAVAGSVIAVQALRSGRWRTALRDPVVPLVALFVGLAILSAALNAVPPLVAALGIVMTIDAVAIYVVVRAQPVDDRAASLAVTAVVVATLVVAIIGLGQVVVHPRFLGLDTFSGNFGEGARITSFLGNPNPVAMVLSIGIPFALFGSVSLSGARERWAASIALLVLVLALVFTFSRSGWLAVGIGVLIIGLVVDRRALLVFMVTVVVAVGLFSVLPRGLAAPQPSQDGGAAIPPSDLVDSTVDRLGNLAREGDTRRRYTVEGIPILLDHPWLGVGPGRYGGAAATLLPSPIYDEYDTGLYGYRTIHSFWQHLLGESGALGTAVFLAILAGLLLRVARAARLAGGRRRVILAGVAGMVVITGLHSLTEMIYEGNLPALLIWLLLGLASMLAPIRPLLGDRSGASQAA